MCGGLHWSLLGGFGSQQGWLLGKTFSFNPNPQPPTPNPRLSLLYPRIMSRVGGLCWGQSEGGQGVTVVCASCWPHYFSGLK